MKYRPSPRFLGIVTSGGVLSVALWFGALPEMEDERAVPVAGEIVFREKGGPLVETGTFRSTAVLPPMVRIREWLGGSFDELMR